MLYVQPEIQTLNDEYLNTKLVLLAYDIKYSMIPDSIAFLNYAISNKYCFIKFIFEKNGCAVGAFDSFYDSNRV